MKIHRSYNATSYPLDKWADEYGVTLSFGRQTTGAIFCYFLGVELIDSVELIDGRAFVGTFGTGQTELDALRDYLPKISGRRVRVTSSPGRYIDTNCPRLVIPDRILERLKP